MSRLSSQVDFASSQRWATFADCSAIVHVESWNLRWGEGVRDHARGRKKGGKKGGEKGRRGERTAKEKEEGRKGEALIGTTIFSLEESNEKHISTNFNKIKIGARTLAWEAIVIFERLPWANTIWT